MTLKFTKSQSLCTKKLFFSRSVNGASLSARTAAYALVCVDNVLSIAFRNATGGASISASAASDAIIRNLVCHNNLPPYYLVQLYSNIFREKIKSFFKKVQAYNEKYSVNLHYMELILRNNVIVILGILIFNFFRCF